MEIYNALFIGSKYLCQKKINAAKNKTKCNWIEFSLKEDNLNEIESVILQNSMFGSKIVLLKEIPDRKEIIEFLSKIIKYADQDTKIIIFDSECVIKKNNKIAKKWSKFINDFKKTDNSKLIENINDFDEKQTRDCVDFVIDEFKNRNININYKNASLFANIVGKKIDLLYTEIEKFALVCGKEITEQFIYDNAYFSNKEVVLYKFNNVLDEDYGSAMEMMKRFIKFGINSNVMAEMIVKKTRWQLIAIDYWVKGNSWFEISNLLMDFGKYPLNGENGKSYEGIDEKIDYLSKNYNISKDKVDVNKNPIKKESLPMDFLAKMIVDNLKKKIKNGEKAKVKQLYLQKYLYMLDKLKEIRYGEFAEHDLEDMIKVNFS